MGRVVSPSTTQQGEASTNCLTSFRDRVSPRRWSPLTTDPSFSIWGFFATSQSHLHQNLPFLIFVTTMSLTSFRDFLLHLQSHKRRIPQRFVNFIYFLIQSSTLECISIDTCAGSGSNVTLWTEMCAADSLLRSVLITPENNKKYLEWLNNSQICFVSYWSPSASFCVRIGDRFDNNLSTG